MGVAYGTLVGVGTLRVLSLALPLALWARAAVADADACPPKRDEFGWDGCIESCDLPKDADEHASESFIAKLRTIGPTGHHIDTSLGDALLSRGFSFRVLAFELPTERAKRWEQNHRWAGPCTGLVALFHSKAVEDKDTKDVVNLYELRYRTEAEARRAASLLETSWDWNYHPFVAVHSGRSVFVAEGRHRAWDALGRVAKHFGGEFRRRSRAPVPALCDRDGEVPPVFSDAAEGLAVHVLGFSPTGHLAWLEERSKAGGTGATWSLRVADLVNDRELAGKTYQVLRKGAEGLCRPHGADLGVLLSEQQIAAAAFPAFDKPTPAADPTGLVIRAGAASRAEVVLLGRQGSKVLGTISAGSSAAQVLGFLRSPFEARVAAMILVKGTVKDSATLRVFGGRLDRGWKPDTASGVP